MKKIMPFLMAAILLSLATASSASVSYSYDTETTGMMTADESYRLITHGNPIVGNQYSLDLTAINSENASCNHSFSAEDREVNSETNVSYSRNASEMIGGLYLEENLGSSLIIEDGTFVGCYEAAVSFSTEVDLLQLSSNGWSMNGSQMSYLITTSGDGNFEAGLEATTMEGEKDNGNYTLLSEERISSQVGVRSGVFNFTANYNVSWSS